MAKKATLYSPTGKKQVVTVGSKEAANLQSQGWSLSQKSIPVVDETQPIPTYQEFLAGGGSPYANLYSQSTLESDYNPYYQSLQGAEDYQKGIAEQDLAQTQGRLQQDYNQNVGDVNRQYGQNFSDRGLFGSGIYQQELGRALDELGQGFNRQSGNLNQSFQRSYGGGQYTPYSMRKSQIEQDRLAQIEQARLSRQGQAFNVYQQQYYPTVAESYY